MRNHTHEQDILDGVPYRSPLFWIATTTGAAAIIIDLYIVYRFSLQVPITFSLFLLILIGLQLVYQWWRPIRVCGEIRKLLTPGLDNGDPNNYQTALRVAIRGTINMLFFSFGMVLFALLAIAFLLSHGGPIH
jgi:hypothetical protein